MPIRRLAEAQDFHFIGVALGPGRNDDVVIWDLPESDERDRGAIFAELKGKLVAHLLANPGRAAFVVDEAVTVTEDELGARPLGDLVRRGRHFGLEVHVLTGDLTFTSSQHWCSIFGASHDGPAYASYRRRLPTVAEQG